MASNTSSLIFIDANVHECLQLVEGVALNAEVLVLSSKEDGVEQITRALQQRPGTAEIHLVAHGTPGCLNLGSSQLSLDTLDRYQAALGRWFASATRDDVNPGLYLYGCSVAAGDAGAEFLDRMQRITGASIAASTRPVGHSSLGGHWQLDAQRGNPQPRTLATESLMASYQAVLAPPANDGFANAQQLNGIKDTVSGTNAEATHQAGEPIHDPNVSGLSALNQQDLNDSVWYKWTAPSSGPVTVNTFGSAIDTVLAAYTGTAANSLTQVARNDNANGTTQSSITFTASANTTYYFAVDGVGSAQGNLKITLDTPATIDVGQIFQVSESATSGTTIGTIKANETPLTWAIAKGNPDNDGDGKAAFSIDAATGALTVNDADDLDFERYNQLYALDVTANDGSFTSQGTVFVNITDSPDSPVFKSLTPSLTTVNEGSRISLSGLFNDPDQTDSQTVVIDWGNGKTTTIDSDNLSLPDENGNRSFTGINHTYQDNGTYTVNATVTDSTGGTSKLSTVVTVNNVAPTIKQGETAALTVNEDSSTTLLLNATDPSVLDVLTWNISKGAANGTAKVSLSPTGNNQVITYTPTANFSGTDTFEVQVRDDDGGVDTITVNVNVAAQPDAPSNLVLTPSATTLNEGQSVTLGGSFADPDVGDTFTVRIQWGDGSPDTVLPNEALVSDGKGNYTFSTNHTYTDDTNGAAAGINVVVQDSTGAIASASTPITVSNLPPTITPGPVTSISTKEDTATTLTLTAADPADTNFSWQINTGASKGTVSLSADPTGSTQVVTYTPGLNYNGVDSFKIAVNDGDGGISIVEVLVGVDPVNDAPQALVITPSNTNVNEGQTFSLGGTFQDVDLADKHTVTVEWGDGTKDTISGVDSGGGSFSLPANVNHIYKDEGSYSVKVTVTDSGGATVASATTVDVANVAPEIATPNGKVAFESLTVAEDKSVTQLITATDAGALDVLSWSLVGQPANGTVEIVPTGVGSQQQVKYTPNVNFSGLDTFVLQVSDGDGGIDTLTYNVTVQDANDPPQILVNQFNVTEGQTLAVTADVLYANDIETADDTKIVFTISNLTGGDKFLVGGTASTTFTRADILNNNVVFVDGGDETAPSFTIAVFDGTDTTTAQAKVAFTKVNDAPVFTPTNTPLKVSEGGAVPVLTSNISATDEETNATALVYTVSNVVGGTFTLNGSATTTFTQSDLAGGKVFFKHDGTETAPTYTVSVSDGVNTTTRNDVPTFVPVNDSPQFVVNKFSITEGATLLITPDVLDAADVETTDDTKIVFTVSNLASGDKFLVGGNVSTTFTRADVLNGNVVFVDNGDEAAPTFTLAVSDGTASVNAPANITFTKVNDAPVFTPTNTPFTVVEGGTTLVRATNLSASDAETTNAANLVFTVSNVVGGQFIRSGNPVTQFTQADINASLINFRHDGSETVPSYTVTVSDGVNTTVRNDVPVFTPANDAPTFLNNTLTIGENGTVTLTTSDLSATDVETLPNDLIFTVTNIAGGTFLVDGAAQGATVTFKLEDVVLGRVAFQQNGTETKPAYTVKVSDTGSPAGTATSNATVTFNRANDNPTITANTFSITEGGNILLSQVNINGADEAGETPRLSLVYTVSNVVGGRFALGTAQGTAITTFTQADIDNRRVVFIHDGTDTTPNYTLTVADTEGGSATSTTPTITFTRVNEAPVLKVNTLTLNEGQTVVLSQANLLAVDEESAPEQLTYTISGLSGGQFVIGGKATTTFTQADVNNGLVSFVHDDKNAAPVYSVKVTDTVPAGPVTLPSGPFSATGTPTIKFTALNDAPVLVASPFDIKEGQSVTLTNAQLLATDEETTNPANLVYTVDKVNSGTFQLVSGGAAITTFTQADINGSKVKFVHDGSEAAPSYTLTVKDNGIAGDPTSKTATQTVTFDGKFTNLNDLPQILANTLAISEGGLVTLTAANLDASDLETLPNDLKVTIGGITGGTFLIDGVAFGGAVEFTLGDIVLQRISFQHDNSETRPAYTVTVTDADGGVAGPSAVTVSSFNRVNDNPTVLTNTFSITEGGRVILGKANIDGVDEVGETARTALVYTVSNVAGGRFERSNAPGSAIATFTQLDIDQGRIVFVHDGSDTTPNYTLTVADTEGGTDVETAPTITFTRTNEAPVLVNNKLTITEEGTVVLGQANLLATDEESTPDQLTYTVDSISGGAFVVNKVATTTFTQADINNGLVSFVHDGSNLAPQYSVTVTDTIPAGPIANPTTLKASGSGAITFTPVNDAPKLTASAFTIEEGKAVVLTSGQLSAVDEETTNPASLIYTVDKATNGTFQLVATGVGISTFTQADIDAGKVQFVHDGSEVAPSYTVTVKDSGIPSDPTAKADTGTVDFTGSFVNFNDLPQLLANSLTISEDGTVTFTTDNLSADDLETSQVDLVITIDGIAGGRFQIDGADFPPGPVSFALAEVVLGRIRFVQDGTETKPAYTVSVSDGTDATVPVAANVTFNRVNDNPTIVINQFAISEGGTVILSGANISATDEAGETPQGSLKYTVGNVLGGRFALATASGTAITSFTQADIDKSRVVFVHDGSDTTPSYTLTVADLEGGTDVETTPTVTFTRVNQPPALVNNKLTITEGGTVVLGQSNLLASDEESSPDQLVYTVDAVTGGQFSIGGVATTTFTQAEINNGLVSFVHDKSNVAPTYAVTVRDSVPAPPVTSPEGPFTASGTGTVTFNAVNDAPTLTASPFEIVEGKAVTVTSAVLLATDEETTNPANLVYTVDKASNGEFQLVATGATITTFTQADVNNNQVQFKHNDSEFAPSYTLTVKDNGLPSDATPATKTTTVTFPDGPGGFININNPPVLVKNELEVQEGTKVTLTSGNLSATDDDSIVSQLSFRIINVTGGTFFLNGVAIDSTAKFTASAVSFGKLTFVDDGDEIAPTYTVEVTDPEGTVTTQDATVKLLPLNDNPAFVNNNFVIDEDGLLELSADNLLATDPETLDPTKLTYTVSNLAGGQFKLFSGGDAITSFTQAQVTNKEIVFLQDGTEVAPTFTVTVSDPDGGSETVKASVTFNATNDPPVLTTNSLTLSEGGTVVLSTNNLGVADPDTLPANLVFTISGLTAGQGQFELDVDGDGKFETVGATSFTLQDVSNGRVRFVDDGDNTAPTYSVSVKDELTSTLPQAAKIAFSTVNDVPTANDDKGVGFTTSQNTTFTTPSVLTNDSDADGNTLTITQVDGKAIATGDSVTLVSGALLTLNANGTFSYNPNGKFSALPAGVSKTDSFVYTVSDGQGGSDTATVEVVVNGVNDSPVANDDGGQGFSTNEGTVLTTPNVLLNDTDIDGDTLSILEVDGKAITVGGSVTVASGAKVTLNANGTFAYDPSGKFEPLAAGATKTDTFTYTLGDGKGGTDSATVSVVINGLNDAPVAVKDGGAGFSTNEDTAFKTGSVLVNDTDIDGDPLSIIQVNGTTITVGGPAIAIASGAKVSLNGDGTFTYDPNKAFEALANGDSKLDSFTYAVSDGKGGTSAATVEVAVTGLNDAPIATNDTGSVSERLSLKLNVLANDSDPDPGDTLTLGRIGETAIASGSQVALASGSLILVNSDFSLTYVPLGFTGLAAGQVGSDSFTYTLIDSQGQESAATVSLQITGYTPPATVNGVFDFQQFAQYADLNSGTTISYSAFEVGGLPFDQLFDEHYYLSQYSDVSAAIDAGIFESGYDHFTNSGWQQGRNPSALYSEAFYLSQNPDVAQAISAGAFTSGFAHFAQFGHKEGRNPSALFNQQDYLLSNPDVANAVNGGAFGSGFEHYVEFGSSSNRLPSLYLYNEGYYLQQNPDVAQAVASNLFSSGFEHYVKFGQKEPQRNPSAIFNESSYLNLNPDVRTAVNNGAFSSGFEHYEEFGRFEGRAVFG